MQAHLMGFVWELGSGITLEEFVADLATLKDQPVKFNGYNRLLYVAAKKNYHLGLFLTVKDQRKFCEIQESGGEFKITVRSLEQRSNLMDFNFFIVNKTTGRGIYQHYHHSCSINQFGIFLQRQFEDLREERKDKELDALGGEEAAPAKDKRRINEKYKGRFSLEVMVRKERLEEILAELAKIKFFDFELAELTAKEPVFNPLTGFIKKESHRLRFRTDSLTDGLAGAISGVVNKLNIFRGRVGGTDDDGRERVFRLLDNPDTFGEFEYDDIADETILNLKQIDASPFLDKMLDIVAKKPALFEKPVAK